MELCGVTPIADRTVSTLSTASRRLVELARCLSWPFSVLLLDEPTAGLDRTESQRLGEIMQAHLAGGGIILAATHGPLQLEGARELNLDGASAPTAAMEMSA